VLIEERQKDLFKVFYTFQEYKYQYECNTIVASARINWLSLADRVGRDIKQLAEPAVIYPDWYVSNWRFQKERFKLPLNMEINVEQFASTAIERIATASPILSILDDQFLRFQAIQNIEFRTELRIIAHNIGQAIADGNSTQFYELLKLIEIKVIGMSRITQDMINNMEVALQETTNVLNAFEKFKNAADNALTGIVAMRASLNNTNRIIAALTTSQNDVILTEAVSNYLTKGIGIIVDVGKNVRELQDVLREMKLSLSSVLQTEGNTLSQVIFYKAVGITKNGTVSVDGRKQLEDSLGKLFESKWESFPSHNCSIPNATST